MKEFIIFVCTDSTEIFLSKLRSSCSNYNCQVLSLTLSVRGVSYKHCLLTFFIFYVAEARNFIRKYSCFDAELFKNVEVDKNMKLTII